MICQKSVLQVSGSPRQQLPSLPQELKMAFSVLSPHLPVLHHHFFLQVSLANCFVLNHYQFLSPVLFHNRSLSNPSLHVSSCFRLPFPLHSVLLYSQQIYQFITFIVIYFFYINLNERTT
ncbi:hypothetical protein BT96DRAFT_563143 [Gymnopus androsaceus JB14]|uniref:Uncharacterized protein n=1 Tax=Gymnopus androsaceus JB14 TaxID=1447944 RepID=A0A6A4HSR6_9AGAR|nr:hypothetical protein BT96DRAFT_563143 [Gymnopus androsaceus JB14]